MESYMANKLLDKNKYYAASTVIRRGYLGDWVKSVNTFLDILKTERGQEVFKPILKQGSNYMTYRIKGQTIMDVMKLIEKGDLQL